MTRALVRKVPTVAHAGTAAAMLAVAASQVGFREGSNNDTPFGLWYRMNNVAWCAIFVSWAAVFSGSKQIVPRHAYTPAGAAWFKARGQWGTQPKVGAIAYFHSSSMGRISHVEIVERVNPDGSFISLGGNTNNTGSREGNGVYRQRRTSTRGGGFGYPAYLPAPKPQPAKEKPAESTGGAKAAAVVDLSEVVAEARKSRRYTGPVAAALKKEGLTPTVAGYAEWQRRCGFRGSDADGMAGAETLGKLGRKRGWTVKA